MKKGACMPKSVPNGLSFLFNGGVNGWVPEEVIWTKLVSRRGWLNQNKVWGLIWTKAYSWRAENELSSRKKDYIDGNSNYTKQIKIKQQQSDFVYGWFPFFI
jgi:hypothetical protein